MDEQKQRATVLLSVKTGTAWDVAKAVQHIEGVTEAYVTAGAWDVVVHLEFHYYQLGQIVKHIQKIGDVIQTVTLVEVLSS